MGLGGMGIWELLLILAIVVMLFGTKRLGSLGPDLGNAIRGFRKAMQPGEEEVNRPEVTRQAAASQAIDASVERVEQQR